MRLPAPLSRRKRNVYKNQFGHILILAGSPSMVGAACLTGLSAMRAGAGLVTLGVPRSLNSLVQKKASNVIMTLPLKETAQKSISSAAFPQVKKIFSRFNAIAIGPGLSTNGSTKNFVLKIISSANLPIVIDADALNILAGSLNTLAKSKNVKILTPHPGEMARLTKLKKSFIEKNRKKVAADFAKKNKCILLLKGHQTVVASPAGRTFINRTGNPGMATAGSGDVLTGIIAAFLGQGLSGFEAAKYGAYIHGKAGDLAARKHSPLSLVASDIIDYLAQAVKSSR